MTSHVRPMISIESRRRALAVTLLVITIAQAWVIDEVPGITTGHPRFTVVYPFDAVIFIALVILGPAAAAFVRTHLKTPAVVGLLVVLGATAAGFAFHPSLKGAVIVYRMTAATIVALGVAELSPQHRRRIVVGPMMAMAALQGLLAIGQLVTDSSLGLEGVGGGAPDIVDGVARAPGMLGHPYVLASYALLAVSLGVVFRPHPMSRLWLVGLAGATVPVAVTFSRAAVVGLLFAGVVVAGRAIHEAEWRRIMAAVGIRFLVPAAIFAASWAARVGDSSVTDFSPDQNVRYELAAQALRLIESDWLLGVGTGQYIIELEDRFEIDPAFANPVHNVPVYLLAEWGLIMGGLVLASLGIAAWRLWRLGPEGKMLLLLLIGFVMLDALHVVYPIGLFLSAITLGAAVAVDSDREQVETPSAAGVA